METVRRHRQKLSRVRGPAALAAFVAPLFGCATLFPPRAEVPAGPRDLDAASPEERAEYVRRAQVWMPIDTASADLLAGPRGPDAFAFEQEVACDVDPSVEKSGATPKFHCIVAPGDSVKVKYGEQNLEVYGEVAATRLLWALGFGADRQYPVRVTCRGCPPDPWSSDLPAPGSTHTFDPAIMERDAGGEPIKVRKLPKGWEWWELQTIDERVGGAPRAHVDALRLLAAFIQHSDNKREQQSLLCLPGGVERTADGQETCTRPFLVTTDLGTTFARAGLRNSNKFELHHWSEVPVWKDPRRCIAKLKRSLTGTISDPAVSEAGRAFLAERLMQLSRAQIRDLFVAARADRAGDQVRSPGGGWRAATADDWTEAFLRRRAEIVEHRCPE
jgi:hypothetical protein